MSNPIGLLFSPHRYLKVDNGDYQNVMFVYALYMFKCYFVSFSYTSLDLDLNANGSPGYSMMHQICNAVTVTYLERATTLIIELSTLKMQ